MTPTLLLSDKTVKLLKSVMERERLSSYEGVIQELIWRRGAPKSLFGAAKWMKWTKEDRMDFHEG